MVPAAGDEEAEVEVEAEGVYSQVMVFILLVLMSIICDHFHVRGGAVWLTTGGLFSASAF